MRIYVTVTFIALLTANVVERPCSADEQFSFVIDPFTGEASLRNDGPASVNLDSYFVTSAGSPVFEPITGWNSLQDNGTEGWQETFTPTGDRLGELNLFGSLAIPSGDTVSLGTPYSPFSPAAFGEVEPGLSALEFKYTLANESQQRVGDVEFSARNTVVLVVDPNSGFAKLENQSPFSIELDSYLIKSGSNVLDSVGWSPLASEDMEWTSSTGASNRLAEGNLFGSSPLVPGGGFLEIGNPIDPQLLNDESELELEFTVAGSQTVNGGVLFSNALSSPLDGDFDADGDVDGSDFLSWQRGESTNPFSSNDLAAWETSFGSSATQAATATVAVIPEPASGYLLVLAAVLGSCVGMGRRIKSIALPEFQK